MQSKNKQKEFSAKFFGTLLIKISWQAFYQREHVIWKPTARFQSLPINGNPKRSIRPAITDKIFETNFRFHVIQRTTGKVIYLFLRNVLLVLTKFLYWVGDLAVGYNSTTFWDFCDIFLIFWISWYS